MSSIIKPVESQSIIEYLRYPVKQSELKNNSRRRFVFITHLLETFGKRYAEQVKSKLDRRMAPAFQQISDSYEEIRKRLLDKKDSYAFLDFPKTAEVIKEYKLPNQSDQHFYHVLKTRMFRCLQFPQILLTYPQPDMECLASIENVRENAFRQMNRFLIPPRVEERKEESPLPRPLTPEEELSVGKLYFSGGALIHRKRLIYFSELISIWGTSNEQTLREFLKQLTIRNWIEENPKPKLDLIGFLTHAQRGSFRNFLIACSLQVVQENLEIRFSRRVERVFSEAFQNEGIRSDVCYFTGDAHGFYQIDLSQWKRPSVFFLYSLQLFFYLVRTCGVKFEKQEKLLEYLVCRSPAWQREVAVFEIDGFMQRSWKNGVAREEDPDFTTAWEGLEQIVINSADPSQECWSLLYLFWKNRQMGSLMTFFGRFIGHPNFTMTLPMIYRFCIQNEHVVWETLEEDYRKVLETLESRNLQITNAQNLFIDPPLQEGVEVMAALPYAPERAALFIDHMSAYGFPVNDQYIFMLRHFIFDPNIQIFQLLEHAEMIGIEAVSHELLWKVLSISHNTLPISNQFNEQEAQQYAMRIQARYRFSDVDIFLLYLEIIRLIANGEASVIGLMAQVSRKLEEFCPSLAKKDIHFLFLYHPQIDLQQVSHIVEARLGWARDEAELNRFIISPLRYQGMLRMITNFVDTLAEACDVEEAKNPFMNTCQQALLSAFFPPLQPLTDYFRISNVTADGIKWNGPDLMTHLGQVKFILGNASLGVYFDWDILNGFPTLFISFFDVTKRTAFSMYVPIEVHAETIESEAKRKPFYSFLFLLSQQVLREEADRPNLQSSNSSETPESWIPCFTGLSEYINSFSQEIQDGNLREDDIEKIWDFCKRVKIGYRTLFLTSVGDRPLPPTSFFGNHRRAAMGHIYTSATFPRGALIPDDLLGIEIHPEYYLPDAPEFFVEQCMGGVFQERTRDYLPLNLNMVVHMGDGYRLECPIFYRVQSSDDLEASERIGEADQPHRRSDLALGQDQIQGRYVTICFQQPGRNQFIRARLRIPPEAFQDLKLFMSYFDYLNLLLKSKYYYELNDQDPLSLEESASPPIYDAVFDDFAEESPREQS